MAVLAGHVVFGTYGFWLPNDPRGSGSKFVGGDNLLPFGKATFLEERTHSVAAQPHDSAKRIAAKEALLRLAVRFAPKQIQSIGDGFGEYVRKRRITIWACSILPDHVHLVIARHQMDFEIIAGQLKNSATRALKKQELHPFSMLEEDGETPSCWGERPWVTFLDTEGKIISRIVYVKDNLIKADLPEQKWPFVVPYPTKFIR